MVRLEVSRALPCSGPRCRPRSPEICAHPASSRAIREPPTFASNGRLSRCRGRMLRRMGAAELESPSAASLAALGAFASATLRASPLCLITKS